MYLNECERKEEMCQLEKSLAPRTWAAAAAADSLGSQVRLQIGHGDDEISLSTSMVVEGCLLLISSPTIVRSRMLMMILLDHLYPSIRSIKFT